MIINKQDILLQLSNLIGVVEELREKCPWDKKQTIETLRPLTIEETFELSEAILKQNFDEIKKELGDLLLHLIFYSIIGAEKERFTLGDVAETLITKLKYRHPHIYGDTNVESSIDVEKNWEQLKLQEKDREKRVLSGVPSSLPSIIKALRIQQKARSAGFDWEQKAQVWDKVEEEFKELQNELFDDEMSQERAEGEFGDLLFAVINAGRLYGIDPDTALERTNKKFIDRFNYLESQSIKKGKSLHDMTLDEMETIWQEAKKSE